MTDSFFKLGMAFMQKIFGAKIADDILTVYWNLMKDFSDEEFNGIQQRLISDFIPTSQVPFPLPAHFLAAAGKSGESRAKLAVNAVIKASYEIDSYYTVSFGDPALHETIDRFGGWPVVCRWTLEDWRYQEKSFIACYEAALISNNGAGKCPGLFEIENADKTLDAIQKQITDKFNAVRYYRWTGFNRQIETQPEQRKNIQHRDGKGIQGIGEIVKDMKL
jgi:hypothetical protein